MKNKTILIALMFMVSLIANCNSDDVIPEVQGRGTVIESQVLGSYPTAIIRQQLAAQGIGQPITDLLSYEVELIRIVYQTIGKNGREMQASGALLIPRSNKAQPLLSIQHGVVFNQKEVISEGIQNASEGLAGLVMASMGYITSVPDYLGYGISDGIHPYINASLTASAVIDMLRATKNYLQTNAIQSNGQLFLYGYSEGGYATLAAQREIETNHANEFSLVASAPMAGPYDALGTLTHIFENKDYSYIPNLAFALTSYNDIYEWNKLDQMINSPYHQLLNNLFNGQKTLSEIQNALPNSFEELMNPQFVERFLNGNEPQVTAAFLENSLLDWTPGTPVRLFHGTADQEVPYLNATNTLEKLKQNGATDIELISFEGADHSSANLPSILGMIQWFESLRN